jgi:recombination protein RecA
MSKKERFKAIQSAISAIEKHFGKGSIMALDGSGDTEIETVPTGSLALDVALGVGGLPKGRVVEIYGPESSGKTTMTLHAIAQAQKAGGTCAFIDAEHAFDPVYAKRLGVKLEELLVSQPDSGEQALEIADQLARSGAISLIIIDSVAALVPRAEIEGEMGDTHMGLQARLMSQALRKLTAIVHKQNTCVVFINQLRQKIGMFFGNPETTPGGQALKFYASVRLDIRRIGQIKQGDVVIGSRVRIKVVKNKCAPPFRQAEFEVIHGNGIAQTADFLEVAIQSGVVEKAGSWYMFEGERVGQGRERALEYFEDRPELRASVRDRILTAMRTSQDTPVKEAA